MTSTVENPGVRPQWIEASTLPQGSDTLIALENLATTRFFTLHPLTYPALRLKDQRIATREANLDHLPLLSRMSAYATEDVQKDLDAQGGVQFMADKGELTN